MKGNNMNREQKRRLFREKKQRKKRVEGLLKGLGTYTYSYKEGTKVRINPSKVNRGNPLKNKWIDDHIDKLFTITYDPRFDRETLIYSFKEDMSEPKWLFSHTELVECNEC